MTRGYARFTPSDSRVFSGRLQAPERADCDAVPALSGTVVRRVIRVLAQLVYTLPLAGRLSWRIRRTELNAARRVGRGQYHRKQNDYLGEWGERTT